MIDVEECVRHGWRFLRLKPYEVYKLTHKEFIWLCEENVEHTHDKREEEAMFAIMYAVASRGKGKKGAIPKVHELYNRDNVSSKEDVESVLEQQAEAMEWLKKFNIVDKE